jgi:hypothetical protein
MDGIVTYKDIEKVAIKYLTKINNANRFWFIYIISNLKKDHARINEIC